MTDRKISQLTEITDFDIDNDVLAVVDTSATETKKTTVKSLVTSFSGENTPYFVTDWDELNALTTADIGDASDGRVVVRLDIGQEYKHVSSGHITTTAGLGFNVVAEGGSVAVEAFGAIGDGVTDDSAAISAALTSGFKCVFDSSAYGLSSTVSLPSGASAVFKNGACLKPLDKILMVNISGSAPASFVNLSGDASEGDTSFATGSVSWSVGDWLEVRSDATLPDTTSVTSYCSFLCQVVSISGYTTTIDAPLPYDFNTADTARVGVCAMVENVDLEGLQLNSIDYSQEMAIGLRVKYAYNVAIDGFNAYGSKTRLEVEDETLDAGINALSINNCVDVVVRGIDVRHIAWYGVGVNGACRNITVEGGGGTDVRHLTSIVYDTYGEPINVLFKGLTGKHTIKTVFDTHDAGRDVRFVDCAGYYTGTNFSVYNIRSPNVTIVNPIAAYADLDGIATSTEGRNLTVINPMIYKCGRSCIGMTDFGGNVVGGTLFCNGAGDECLSISSGSINGTILDTSDGGYPIRLYAGDDANTKPLLLDGVRNERGGLTGDIAILAQGAADFSKVFISNSIFPDYWSGNTMFFSSSDVSAQLAPSVTNSVMSTDIAKIRGRATLASGTVTVSNNAIEILPAATSRPLYASSIKLRRASGSSTGALSYTLSNGSGFTINSTDASDTSIVEWWVDG